MSTVWMRISTRRVERMNKQEMRRGIRRLTSLGALTALAGGALTMGLVAPAVAAPFVTGKVTDSAGRPISGASVGIYDSVTQSQLTSESTDSDGVFKVFTGAASVKIRVQAFTANDLYAPEWYNDKASFATADAVAIPVTGADLGVIALTAGGSISGVVTSDAGVPLDRVRVDADGDENGFGEDYTDKTGAYTIKGLPADSYTVGFSDNEIDEFTTEYYNNTTDFTAATPVVVAKDAAVGGINAGLAPATPIPPISGPDITGTVVDSASVAGIGVAVTAYNVGAKQRDAEAFETVYTNRQGVFTFTNLDTTGQTQFRLRAQSYQHEFADFARFTTWSGGSQTYQGATPVAITPGGAAVTHNLSPVVAGGISGTVTSDTTKGPASGGSVFFVDDQGNGLGGASVNADGTYEARNVAPGVKHVKFDADDHVAEWWKNAATVEKATPVTVKSNQLLSGISASLGQQLTALEKPEIVGFPVVGKPITVDPGTWNQQDGSLFEYEWLANGVLVGTGQTITPTAAIVGKKLSVRVTNNPGFAFRVFTPATVTTKSTAKVGYKTKFKVKVKGSSASFAVKNQKVKAKKIKGKVTVQITDGEDVQKKVLGKAKIKAGKGSVSLAKVLKKLDKGEKVVFTFIAKTAKVASADATKKIGGKKKKG